jgi:hypothetical protein
MALAFPWLLIQVRSVVFLYFLSIDWFYLLDPSAANVVPDAPAHCSAVRLPYSLVPGLDTSSTAYNKALYVLSKQDHAVHARTLCAKASPADVNVPMDLGILFYFSHPLFLILICSSLDHPAGVITEAARAAILRGRDILSDPLISELNNDNPQAQESFQNSLRYQVVVSCQRLHVLLQLIDRLMELYNQSLVPQTAA